MTMDLVWILVLIAIAVFARRNRNPYLTNRIGGLSRKLIMVVLAILAIRVLVNRNDDRPKEVAKVDETTMEELSEATTVEETEATTEETTVVLTLEDKIKSVYGDDYVSHTVEEGSIVVFTKGSVGWSGSSTYNYLDGKVVELLETIQDEDYIDLMVITNADAIDQYGNDTEKLLYQVSIEKSEADKINFDNFKGSMLKNIARSRYIDEEL